MGGAEFVFLYAIAVLVLSQQVELAIWIGFGYAACIVAGIARGRRRKNELKRVFATVCRHRKR